MMTERGSMYEPAETRRADEELRILAAVKRKMGAKKPVFGDFAQRKCPVFLTTYAKFGKLMNLFSSEDKVEKDYMKMERRFLSFVKALEVEASHLDALFWNEMRSTPHIVSTCLTGSRQPQITGSLLHS
jgi:hypothetical protein